MRWSNQESFNCPAKNAATKRRTDQGYSDYATEQKTSSRKQSHERIVGENVIRRLEIFRILSEPYRNRRKRLALVQPNRCHP
jgi:hypothetical protein